MLKLMGIAGIVMSMGLLGMSKTKSLKFRIQLLEDYYEMVLNLKGQIGYFKEPLPDIFEKLSQNNSSKAYLFLKALITEIKENASYSSNFWAKNLIRIYGDTVLTEEDIEIMSYVGEFVGQTDYNNHLQHFAYIEDKLLQQITSSKNLYVSKAPMYNKIGFFIGAIIGMIFI